MENLKVQKYIYKIKIKYGESALDGLNKDYRTLKKFYLRGGNDDDMLKAVQNFLLANFQKKYYNEKKLEEASKILLNEIKSETKLESLILGNYQTGKKYLKCRENESKISHIALPDCGDLECKRNKILITLSNEVKIVLIKLPENTQQSTITQGNDPQSTITQETTPQSTTTQETVPQSTITQETAPQSATTQGTVPQSAIKRETAPQSVSVFEIINETIKPCDIPKQKRKFFF